MVTRWLFIMLQSLENPLYIYMDSFFLQSFPQTLWFLSLEAVLHTKFSCAAVASILDGTWEDLARSLASCSAVRGPPDKVTIINLYSMLQHAIGGIFERIPRYFLAFEIIYIYIVNSNTLVCLNWLLTLLTRFLLDSCHVCFHLVDLS